MTSSHFLVLGGTGSIGFALTKALLQGQEQVTLLARSKHSPCAHLYS